MSKKKISKAQIKRNRKAWVEALRSGKFRQTRQQLKSRNGAYCCLGVLCEVAGLPSIYKDGEYVYADAEALEVYKNDDGWSEPDLENYYDRYSVTDLPLAGREWLGIDRVDVRLARPVEVRLHGTNQVTTEDSLIELNDTYGWTFEQIADAIEKIGLAE